MPHSSLLQSAHMCGLLPAALRTCRPTHQAACAARLTHSHLTIRLPATPSAVRILNL